MFLLRNLVSDAQISVDVGANQGIYSFVLASLSKKVIAFEPASNCADALRKTLPSNCEVIQKAVSSSKDSLMLRTPVSANGSKNTGLATVAKDNRLDGSLFVEEKIEVTTLDDQLSNCKTVDFIKIDVEGHEQSVLEGARTILEMHHPALLVETEYRHGANVLQIFDLMQSLGYQAKCYVEGKLVAVDAESLRLMQNGPGPYINNVFFFHAD